MKNCLKTLFYLSSPPLRVKDAPNDHLIFQKRTTLTLHNKSMKFYILYCNTNYLMMLSLNYQPNKIAFTFFAEMHKCKFPHPQM